MRSIHVSLDEKSYDIIIKPGILDEIADFVDSKREIVIITDDYMPKQYVSLLQTKIDIDLVLEVPVGEQSKSMEMASSLVDSMLEFGITRSAIILAVGGGVIGDLAGFVASIYMRGIDYIQIPTTLLSQIDSSVGGKVAVNTHLMKNAIGSFYQPKLVLIDSTVLKTLEKRQFNSGVAEMIKYGLIQSSDLFSNLLKQDYLIENIDLCIYECIDIKRKIVEEDEFDYGKRQLLNYGHTIGHALEQASQYELLHGEAIAIGMLLMSKGYNYSEDLEKVLRKYNLPTNYEYNKEQLLSYIKTDKKVQKNRLNIVLVDNVGNGFIKTINVDDILSYM